MTWLDEQDNGPVMVQFVGGPLDGTSGWHPRPPSQIRYVDGALREVSYERSPAAAGARAGGVVEYICLDPAWGIVEAVMVELTPAAPSTVVDLLCQLASHAVQTLDPGANYRLDVSRRTGLWLLAYAASDEVIRQVGERMLGGRYGHMLAPALAHRSTFHDTPATGRLRLLDADPGAVPDESLEATLNLVLPAWTDPATLVVVAEAMPDGALATRLSVG